MGLLIAITIITLWAAHLIYCLFYVQVNFNNPFYYIHILIQGYLYTGLFITAHDSMHGTVSLNKKVNNAAGVICSFLFAGLSFRKLLQNHKKHHSKPGTSHDPDFYTGSDNFFVWWFIFLKRYVSLVQLVTMALIFNLMKLFFAESSIWSYFVVPAFLSTLQLFFFGTYLPHKRPHTNNMTPHNSRTQSKNHLWAMISCYFFGYHSEHHENPRTPWWKMYRLK